MRCERCENYQKNIVAIVPSYYFPNNRTHVSNKGYSVDILANIAFIC